MPDENTRPTPASGMPAVSAPAADRLLVAIEEVRDDVRDLRTESREESKKTEARFERFELRLNEVAGQTETNTKNIGLQADALTRVASAAAKSVDIALEAKQVAGKASDEASSIVASALKIHGASIAMTVDDSVKQAVRPLVADIETLKTDNATQNASLTALTKNVGEIGQGITTLVKLGTSKRIGAYVAIGAMVGGAMMAIAEKVMK